MQENIRIIKKSDALTILTKSMNDLKQMTGRKIYDTTELEKLSEEELVACLRDSWEMEDDQFEVWGEINKIKSKEDITIWRLINPYSIKSNKLLIYPLRGHDRVSCSFFINPVDGKKFGSQNHSRFIRCKLELSPRLEREKHQIPFEMNVAPGSCSSLIELPSVVPHDIFTFEDKTSFLTENIYEFYRHQAEEKIKQDIESLKSIHSKELLDTQKKLESVNKEILLAVEKREAETQHNTRLEIEKQNSIRAIEALAREKQNKDLELSVLTKEIFELESEMSKKIDRLKNYVSEKVDFLRNFEFIDEEDANLFLLEPKPNSEHVNGVIFKDALNGDYRQAVSYIQAYLVAHEILYPRHIIENYLTLLRTKDLIILAGDSGSGKTNLVKSFARAVGGKSVIIPVKPNWTSSEDLLGYYNPIEKKYIATPFLEALIEATQNPEIPYFICLDEMNLARVEYYFADFLSLLESRDETPEIKLYGDDESSHVLSELKTVVDIIQACKEKYNRNGVVKFIEILKDDDLNSQLRQAFGFGDKDSLIKYHSEIRRMLSAVMTMPSSIKMPVNVHLIGAINIDETTHYLSPKILDRAHVMRFESPLLFDWNQILDEVDQYDFEDVSKPLIFDVESLGVRENYPKFDRDNEFCRTFTDLNKEFFHPLGIEFGMRTIRQGLHYQALFNDVNNDNYSFINNFLLHKVLPKFTFDGSKKINEGKAKLDNIENVLIGRIKDILPAYKDFPDVFSAVIALETVVKNARENEGIVNFWS